jgi:ATP-dependent helicase/nuclease subunit A
LATSNPPRSSQPSLFDASAAEPEAASATPDTPAIASEAPEAPAAPASQAASGESDPDASARRFAVEPDNNVVLEASAGTGKTSVLVARYVNLLKRGVDPANILAITFTRKAAAEMRELIVRELGDAAARSELDRARWIELRDRLGDIAISTIDAFCLSLLREFPLEADLDPGFDLADETEVPRLIETALDQALRILTNQSRTDPDVALVFAQLGIARTREGLASLLERRLVAWAALDRFLAKGPADLTAGRVCQACADRLHAVLGAAPGGLARFLEDGPVRHQRYQLLVREIQRMPELAQAGDARFRAVLDRIAAHFLTAEGRARRSGAINPYRANHYRAEDAAKRHRSAVFELSQGIADVVFAFKRDLNVVLARGVKRMFAVALAQYRQVLDERSVLDFADVLDRALELLRRMDEFSQSRFRLEARYHHVLVDEFQDTSRAQWELVALLIESWGEGTGVTTNPSIFVVGDRKQSIYRFRDAEAAVLQEAARHIQALRPAGNPRRSITKSFRALPTLLAFVNDLFAELADSEPGGGRFTYTESDRFPIAVTTGSRRDADDADNTQDAGRPDRDDRFQLGIAAANDPVACAALVADEIQRILREDSVRDRKTGVPRRASPGDIGVLFRSRASHREFERELERRSIPAYVYKGLGFFDADETKDAMALIRFLANPSSDLRAAAFLRSRFIRLSDAALATLAPRLADALFILEEKEEQGDKAGDRNEKDVEADADLQTRIAALGEEDGRVLAHARRSVPRWVAQVDRVPPAELFETILAESAYAYELRGPRLRQARENVKKMRSLVRRIQNHGYATMPRIADHLDSLTAGDESNAVLEALDAVNLMTVHASKGLEFPIVFVVNMAKGASGPPRPMRVVVDADAQGEEQASVTVGPFVSEMDEAERQREKHETKRLLYVALTRARDRLYLASALKDGVMAPGRGSLGEVFPQSIRDLIARAGASSAAAPSAPVTWTSAAGTRFDWRVCTGAARDPDAT